MKKLSIVDLNFVWPPDGGAPVDLFEIANRFSDLYDTTLIIPRLTHLSRWLRQPWPLSSTKFFLRGQYHFNTAPKFKIKAMDLSFFDFSAANVARTIKDMVDQGAPDHVLIADGWYYKPKIVSALSKYRPVVRLYAHEMICLKGNGHLFRRNRVCDVNYLDGSKKTFRTCRNCAASFYVGYPSPRWVMEFFRSGAFKRGFQMDCVESFSRASKVLVGNSFIANRIAPFIRTEVRAVPHGVDTARFRPPESGAEPASSPFRFLVAGRMEMKNKGLSTVLQASLLLAKRKKNFRLQVASNCKIGSYDFIERIPWHPHEKVHKIYQDVHALIVPSLWPDPFPIVVLEGMSSALPILGTDVGGMPEQIESGKSGFLLPPGDPRALAERMEWLIEHQDEAKKMGIVGRERALKLFAIDHVFSEYYETLFS